MPTPHGKTLVRVKETRTGADGGIEGLCEYDDGTEEWRSPDKVSATATVTREDGSVEHRELADVNVTGVDACA